MKKILFAAALLFVFPSSSFAYSVSIDPIVPQCGVQSITVTGTADYSDGQYGPVQGASLIVSSGFNPVLTSTDYASRWSVTVPVSNGSADIEAKMVSTENGPDYQQGTIFGETKLISVPDCSLSPTVVPVSQPVQQPVVSSPQSVSGANKTLIQEFIAFLQAVLK